MYNIEILAILAFMVMGIAYVRQSNVSRDILCIDGYPLVIEHLSTIGSSLVKRSV